MIHFRRAIVPLLALALAGCQGSDTTSKPAPVSLPPPPRAVAKPSSTTPTEVGIVNHDDAVTVGMTSEAAFRVFGAARDGGLMTTQLPAGFSDPYKAQWWETATRGFGVITYDGTVVAAMYQEEHVDDARRDEWLRIEQARMGNQLPTPVEGDRVSYWFWDRSNQRLMLCAFKGEKGLDITVAMGDQVVMDGLGASQRDAETARDKIASLLAGPSAAAGAQPKSNDSKPTGG